MACTGPVKESSPRKVSIYNFLGVIILIIFLNCSILWIYCTNVVGNFNNVCEDYNINIGT